MTDEAQILSSEEQEACDTNNTEPSSTEGEDVESELQWIAADWRNHQLHGYKAGLKKRKQEHEDQIAMMRKIAAELNWIDVSSLKDRESTDEEDEVLRLRVI